MSWAATWRREAERLEREAYTLYFACKDARTPWYAKALAALVAGYAFSPIDLIPDFIPVIGLLDDLLIVPLGVLLVLRLIPPAVRDESRNKAATLQEKPRSKVAAAAIIIIWILAAAAIGLYAYRNLI